MQKEALLNEQFSRSLSAEDTLFGHDEYDYEEYRTRHEASGRDRVHAYRFGKFTILHLSGRQIELSKEFRDPKTPQAIEEMSQKILQKGYDFRY